MNNRDLQKRDRRKPPPPQEPEDDTPIDVYFGNLVLDMGIGNVPKILARYWPYLRFNDLQLSEVDYAMLLQVLLLRDDMELRLMNLPLKVSKHTRERSIHRMRQMGLVFTQRIYYPYRPGHPPCMACQRWDMRSLFHNLEQVARAWLAGQRALDAAWDGKGTRPIFNFAKNYAHDVALPADVAKNILRGVYYPKPEPHWLEQAQQIAANQPLQEPDLRTEPNWRGTQDVRTEPNWRGTEAPTEPNWRGAQPRTEPNWRGHQESLLNTVDVVNGAAENPDAIWAYFSQAVQKPDHVPSEKERKALEKLRQDGFSDTQIIAGIDAALARGPVRHFTHCAAIARDAARQTGTLTPEARPLTRQPESVQPEARKPETRNPEESAAVEPQLLPAVNVIRSAGAEVSEAVLARLRLMAQKADPPAREAGSSGAAWVADTLVSALGRAQPQNLLGYADKILENWRANGRPTPAAAAKQDEALAPEIQVFFEATGRKPLPDQRDLVIRAVQEYDLNADYLRAYWQEWVKRDKKRSDLTWLDWAIRGEIPDMPKNGNAQPAATGVDKLMQALFSAAEKGA